jgi:hypothetical protein
MPSCLWAVQNSTPHLVPRTTHPYKRMSPAEISELPGTGARATHPFSRKNSDTRFNAGDVSDRIGMETYSISIIFILCYI